MSVINYENIVERLLKEFPSFKEWEDFGQLDKEDIEKNTYIVFSYFVRYMLERLEKNGSQDLMLKRFFYFINSQFNNPKSDPQILNLLSVEVFEGFAQTKKGLNFSRENTVGNARHAVEMSLTYTGVERPDFNIAPEAINIVKSIEKYNTKLKIEKFFSGIKNIMVLCLIVFVFLIFIYISRYY